MRSSSVVLSGALLAFATTLEFGLSQGTISKAGTFLDAEGVLRYLTMERQLNPHDLLLFGRSLGTALAVHLARMMKPLGVVLEAAFTGTLEMLRRYFPFGVPSPLVQTVYDNLSSIDAITCPIRFVHGAEDQAIPISMGRTLFDKATAPKFFYEVPYADHNDTYLVGGQTYIERLRGLYPESVLHPVTPDLRVAHFLRQNT